MENYKKSIENILKTNNDIQVVEDNIKKLLKLDFGNHKITEKEYIELKKFLNQKVEEKGDNNKQKTEKRQSNFKEELKIFYQKNYLDVKPIYKGESGIVAPKKKTEISENQEEER